MGKNYNEIDHFLYTALEVARPDRARAWLEFIVTLGLRVPLLASGQEKLGYYN